VGDVLRRSRRSGYLPHLRGIHPPEDDFAGRITGSRIGKDAFAKAMQYFTGTIPH